MISSAILTGTVSFSAFAEGFAAVIAVYSLCKNRDADAVGKKNSGYYTHSQKEFRSILVICQEKFEINFEDF